MTNRTLPPLAMRAAFQPSTLNEEARTVELVWTTGARVLRGWWDQFWEELSLDPKHVRMERLNNGAPFLADHAGHRVASTLGVVETARLEKGRGVAVVRFARAEDDPEADKVFRKIRDGIVQNVSVGYRVYKMEKVEDGEGQIPVMRAVDWEPYEISAVAMGADDGAGFRSVDDTPNPVEVISRGGAPQKEKTMPEAEKQDPGPVTDAARQAELDAARKAAVEAERTRAAEIRKSVRSAGLDAELAEKLINDETPVDKARALVLDELAERNAALGPNQYPSGAVEVGATDREKFLRGAEAWLIQRAGKLRDVQAAVTAGKVRAPETDPGEFRGMTLLGLAREALERSGVSTRRMTDARIAELALSKRAPGLSTPSDFPVLLENVTYKIMLGAYEVTPHEWSRFCARGSVANFHAHNRYRSGAFGTLDTVNDAGELKTKAIPDGERRSVTIGTKGNKIGVSRRMIIQDDMGAFTNLASEFGKTAQNTIEADVWTTLKANSGLGANYDANPLLHTSRNNINTTGSALSAAGLDADAVVMARQAAPSGTTVLNLVPAVLVLPREFRAQANIINNDAFDPDASTKQGKSNPARGMFRDIVASAQLTGTRRYLFADPAVAPVIEVTFLQGQEAPQMESQESFDVLGLEWRIFIDFGVNLVDYRGIVTNAGA